jgi:hypothetical protein
MERIRVAFHGTGQDTTMAALKDKVIADTLDRVKIVYLGRDTAKSWNEVRHADDTAVFCGWFWIRDGEEAGPFRTRSSAIRDAFYRFVLLREIPSVGHTALPGYKRVKQRRKNLNPVKLAAGAAP